MRQSATPIPSHKAQLRLLRKIAQRRPQEVLGVLSYWVARAAEPPVKNNRTDV